MDNIQLTIFDFSNICANCDNFNEVYGYESAKACFCSDSPFRGRFCSPETSCNCFEVRKED